MARTYVWVLCIAAVSAVVVALGWRYGCSSVSPVQLVAFLAAALSLLWSTCSAVVALWMRYVHTQRGHAVVTTALIHAHAEREHTAHRTGTGSFVRLARLAALMFAVAPAVIESVVLVMQLVYVGLDLAYGSPSPGMSRYGFGADGLWTLTAMLISCFVAMASTRDRRLATCGLWITVMIVLWSCLLLPAFRPAATGGFERTGNTVSIVVGLALLLAGTAVVTGWIERRHQWRVAASDPDALILPRGGWPGLRHSFAAIALALIIIVSYHLAVPMAIRPGGFRATLLIVAAGGICAATAAFVILARTWTGYLADAAMGLVSLSLCAAVVSAAPLRETLLASLYPVVFGAMMVGFAMTASIWTWLSGVWHQQLDNGKAWTTTGRLLPYAKRFAFFNIALGLLVGSLLAVWPRIPGIAATDDNFAAVTSGLGANLFLLLVALWSARRIRRWTFHILALLATASTGGFVLARMLPFSSEFG